MSTKTLRWLGIALPLLFWANLTALRVYVTSYGPVVAATAIEFLLVLVAGALFSHWVADRFARHEAEIEQRAQQLEALRQAALAVTTEVELGDVLQRVVELSRDLSGARYAALSVLDASGARIERLLTAGIGAEERARMGNFPQGHGLLGAILTERRAMRIDNILDDPRAAGFPGHHPRMTSLLGVPLQSKGVLLGNLYLTDKQGEGVTPVPFTEQDQSTLEMFAAHASVAIENARLYQQNRQLAIVQERERFGMNLHDGVIQSIYAIGLLLDDAYHRADADPALAKERLGQTIVALNEVIRDIRSYIMDLRPQRFEGRSLEEGLQELAASANGAASLRVTVNLQPGAAAQVTPEQTTELLHVAQEALANIHKHAGASHVQFSLARDGDAIEMVIEDDGRGFDVFRAAAKANGNGLRNMQERARALDGDFEVESAEGKGTRILLSLPLSRS